MNPPPIYGRESELEQLGALVSRLHSFLVHGPAGVGKSLLLRRIAADCPKILYCGESATNHTVFCEIARHLLATRNQTALRAFGRSGASKIKEKSAVSLRGIVGDALRESRYWIVVDHLKRPSQAFATALKDLSNSTHTPLIAAARSAHMEDAGFLLPLFPDRLERLALANFDSEQARGFTLRTLSEMKLNFANQEEVLEKIVRHSQGNPGAIRTMLAMASHSRYVAQQRLMMAPLYIDFRLRGGVSGE